MVYKISPDGLQFIAGFEDFEPNPYIDPVGVPTIGYGTTVYPNGVKVSMKDKPISKERALWYKKHHIENKCYPFMKDLVLNRNQFDAACSFIYNVGGGAFGSSTLKKKILANAPFDEIKAEFNKWVYGTVDGVKVVLPGLVTRRAAEGDLYCRPIELKNIAP